MSQVKLVISTIKNLIIHRVLYVKQPSWEELPG